LGFKWLIKGKSKIPSEHKNKIQDFAWEMSNEARNILNVGTAWKCQRRSPLSSPNTEILHVPMAELMKNIFIVSASTLTVQSSSH
jgi:hypothetical protein